MNGLVYTDSVFNVIGDYPVVDQFDVSYINLLTGSITDQYVTGTLFQKYNKGSAFNPFGVDPFGEYTVYGERGLAFSKCNSNNHKNFPGGDTSYDLQPWGERSGISRCVRIFSSRDRYYDSMTPFYDKMMNVLGGAPNIGAGSGGTTVISIGLSGSSTNSTAIGFHESFPFESKFHQIARSKLISGDYNGQEIVIFEEGRLIGGGGNVVYWFNSALPLPSPSNFTYLKSTDAGKILFGFGDRRKLYTEPGGLLVKGQSRLPGIRRSAPLAANPLIKTAVGPIISGWKYGLISASPYYTSAVFRRDKYGQFRDMLEQRPVAVTVVDSVHSPMKYFGDVETPAFTSQPDVLEQPQNGTDDGATKFTVKVAFSKLSLVSKYDIVNGVSEGNALEYVNLAPSDTDSFNLSTFVTSSLPFFD